MTEVLEIAFIILIIMTVCMLGFLIKLLFDASRLIQNIDETTTFLRKEIEPTLKELNTTMHKLNDITSNANNKMFVAKRLLSSVLGVSSIAIFGLRNVSNSLVSGFLTGLKTFMKK